MQAGPKLLQIFEREGTQTGTATRSNIETTQLREGRWKEQFHLLSLLPLLTEGNRTEKPDSLFGKETNGVENRIQCQLKRRLTCSVNVSHGGLMVQSRFALHTLVVFFRVAWGVIGAMEGLWSLACLQLIEKLHIVWIPCTTSSSSIGIPSAADRVLFRKRANKRKRHGIGNCNFSSPRCTWKSGH